jgi:ABC-type phosphate transport system auxiliary subunit
MSPAGLALIEKDMRGELYKVATRGLGNMMALGKGEAVQNELLKIATQVVDLMTELGKEKDANTEGIFDALDGLRTHIRANMIELKEHGKKMKEAARAEAAAAAPAAAVDKPETSGTKDEEKYEN